MILNDNSPYSGGCWTLGCGGGPIPFADIVSVRIKKIESKRMFFFVNFIFIIY